MDSELKKCPFCGGRGIHIANGGDHWIECKVCKATSGVRHPESEAIAAWNRRADHIHQSVKMVEFTKEELEAIGSLIFRAYPNGGKMNDIEASILAKCESAMKGGE